MYACLAVTCHLHVWQNDRDFIRATVVTRGWNGYRNKSQHRKSILEKKILPPFQQGFEPATFQSRVRCSNHWAIPAPSFYQCPVSPWYNHTGWLDVKHQLTYQCPEVTLCGWWYIKIKELSLDRSTHLFLVMFFLAHRRAPFCSEYFPLFSTHIVSVVLFSSAAQVFSMGLFTCVNFLHFHGFF